MESAAQEITPNIQPPSPVVPENKHNNTILIVVLSILVTVLLLGVVYLAFQNIQLQKQISELNSIKQQNASQPTAVIPTPKINNFQDVNLGISMNLSQNWFGHVDSQSGQDWISYPVDDPSPQSGNTNVVANISISSYSPTNSLQEDINSRSKIGGTNAQLYDPTKAESISVDGKQGLVVVSGDQKYSLVLVDSNRKRYIFTLGTTDTSLVTVFKETVSNLKFVSP